MRILIVEDEPTLRAQLAAAITAAGYAVDVADNGVDGHYLGDTEPCDAVILDLGLPQMDDYLTKPFHMEELLARLRALIRRTGGHASAELVCGPLTLDTRNSRATVAGQTLTLTSHEYRVLAYLMHHRDEVVSRSDLIEHIYAQDFDRDSNTVEVFIARLRKKLPAGLIDTIRGLGYRLSAPK